MNLSLSVLGSHPIFTVDRGKLGQWMLKEAQMAGAEIRMACRVSEIKDDHVLVNGTETGYDHLVGANGSNSIVRKFLNVPVKKTLIAVQYISKTPRRDLEIFLEDFKNVIKYDWIFPHSDFTSIGMGGWTNNAAALRRSLDKLCDKLSIWYEKNVQLEPLKD